VGRRKRRSHRKGSKRNRSRGSKREHVIVARNRRNKRYVVMHYHPEERPPCRIYHSFTSKQEAMRYARRMADKLGIPIRVKK